MSTSTLEHVVEDERMSTSILEHVVEDKRMSTRVHWNTWEGIGF